MHLLYWALCFVATFCIMEFMAWFSHKYIMHGFLWYLHEDHHNKDHDSWFERNDTFFIFYAVISMGFIMTAENTAFLARMAHWIGYYGLWLCLFRGSRHLYTPAF